MEKHLLRAINYKWNRFRRKRLSVVRTFTLAIVLGTLAAALSFLTPGRSGDDSFLENYFYLRGEVPPPKDLVIVSLDDYAWKKVGVHPETVFPRIVTGTALRNVALARPKLTIIDGAVPKHDGDPEGDKILEEAIRMSPTILSLTRGSKGIGKEYHKPENEIFIRSDEKFSAGAVMEIPFSFSPDLTKDLGYTEKGFVKTLAISKEEGEFKGSSPVQLLPPLRKYVDPDIPSPSARDLINFYGPSGTLTRYSIYDVYEGKVEDKAFRDKVVFLGAQTEVGDRFSSKKELFNVPVSNNQMFGVEIHATIAANLLEGSWFRRLKPKVEAFVVYVLVAISVYLCFQLKLFMAIVALATVPIFYAIVAFIVLHLTGLFLPAVGLLLSSLKFLVPLALLSGFSELWFSYKNLKDTFLGTE